MKLNIFLLWFNRALLLACLCFAGYFLSINDLVAFIVSCFGIFQILRLIRQIKRSLNIR